MIDPHTHLLPGIDDGATTVEEAYAMVRLLTEQKVTVAICTPHYDPLTVSMEEFTRRRDHAMSQMKECGLSLVAASETYLHECLLYYNDLSPICIEGTNLLLIELSLSKKQLQHQLPLLHEIVRRYDIIPIIAHVERYSALKKKERELLRETGCILQLNTSSLLREESKRKALQYIRKGFADILGSDCHNMVARPPLLEVGYAVVERELGMNYRRQLEDNAATFLTRLQQ